MINFSDLEDAFLFVSSDQPFINEAVINKKTGKTFYKSDLAGIDDFPDEVYSEDYIEIPHKNDLNLGRNLVHDFVLKHLPQKLAEVDQIFSKRGAYSRFKELLNSTRLLETWYKFEDEQTKLALRQWCNENNLEIDE